MSHASEPRLVFDRCGFRDFAETLAVIGVSPDTVVSEGCPTAILTSTALNSLVSGMLPGSSNRSLFIEQEDPANHTVKFTSRETAAKLLRSRPKAEKDAALASFDLLAAFAARDKLKVVKTASLDSDYHASDNSVASFVLSKAPQSNGNLFVVTNSENCATHLLLRQTKEIEQTGEIHKRFRLMNANMLATAFNHAGMLSDRQLRDFTSNSSKSSAADLAATTRQNGEGLDSVTEAIRSAYEGADVALGRLVGGRRIEEQRAARLAREQANGPSQRLLSPKETSLPKGAHKGFGGIIFTARGRS